jgi:citrate synthase
MLMTTATASAPASGYVPGLEGVVAAETRLSSVNGQAGELIIAGFPVEELASNALFEETVYLLWNEELPTQQQLNEFKNQLDANAKLPDATLDLLRAAAKQQIAPMDALRMATSTLNLNTPEMPSVDPVKRDAILMVARFPVIVASYWRLLQGHEPVTPRSDLTYAGNYLYMLFGQEPSADRARGMATYLNTVSDHGLNASTFTARVIIATGSDMISAITGAIGALKGPLHGGAPGPALDMVFDIQKEGDAEGYLRRKIEAGERFMGFGHRVYKVRDPRADVLAAAAKKLYEADGDMELYNLAGEVEQEALRLLEEYKPGRNLKTNVEFYTALILHGLDLPTELFSPTFAVGRVGGWTAHCFEQVHENRLIRPQSVYIGPTDSQWVPIEQR